MSIEWTFHFERCTFLVIKCNIEIFVCDLVKSISLLSRGYSVYSHPHAAYSSYNPVSRQDSEQQSMSSGRTDSDTMSMSGSSV